MHGYKWPINCTRTRIEREAQVFTWPGNSARIAPKISMRPPGRNPSAAPTSASIPACSNTFAWQRPTTANERAWCMVYCAGDRIFVCCCCPGTHLHCKSLPSHRVDRGHGLFRRCLRAAVVDHYVCAGAGQLQRTGAPACAVAQQGESQKAVDTGGSGSSSVGSSSVGSGSG